MAKTLTGVVTSDRPDKTIIVSVATRKTHPIYKKQYTETKKFMAHDENNEAKKGDKVIISETRPLSARKRFTLSKIAERAGVEHVEASPEAVVADKEEDK
jgi:small subunit ribosomal protein S17